MENIAVAVPINEISPELIIHSLFGMSENELVQDMIKNPNGKWDFLLVG